MTPRTLFAAAFSAGLVTLGLAACEDEKTPSEQLKANVASTTEELKEGDMQSAKEEAGEAVKAVGDAVADATKREN